MRDFGTKDIPEDIVGMFRNKFGCNVLPDKLLVQQVDILKWIGILEARISSIDAQLQV